MWAHPDLVIVVGDVNSTVACSLVAAKARTLVAHVGGEFSEEFVILHLIAKLRNDYRKIKGVKRIKVAYNGDFAKQSTIQVRP